MHEPIRSERISGPLEIPDFPLVVIAASAGGIEALLEILPLLPPGFPACIVVALHLCPSARYKSVLDEVLRRAARLTVKWARNGELLLPSTVYLAPQDHHTIVFSREALHVYRGVRVNRHLPAADPLFISAAMQFGGNSIAVVLSGCSRDASEGAFQLAKAGAKVMVQDASSSPFFEMPAAVTRRIRVDLVASPTVIGLKLAEMIDNWSL